MTKKRGEDDTRRAIASRWRRFGGALLDVLVLAPLLFVGLVVRQPVLSVALAVISAAYYIGCTARWGRTVGKLLVGTRVEQ